MQHLWLNKQKNSNLIIFFSGWGMDGKSVLLDYEKFDIVTFYNYRNTIIKNSLILEFSKYKNIYLIAWSMGVIMSTLLTKKINNIKQTIAINGTLRIIDDKFGIPTKIFNITLSNLNKITIEYFFQNIGCKDFRIPNRNLNSQINELKFIKNFYKNNSFNSSFDKILIGNKDIIVPYKNQKRAWEDKKIITIGSGHYIFNKFKKWEEIIKC